MKNQKKGIVFGFLLALVLMCGINMVLGSGAVASTGDKTLVATYRNVKLCIDGQMVTPTDANGKVVEPFIIDGTTYLPVRAVGSALGKDVDWDGATNTVYLGAKPTLGAADGSRTNPLRGSAGVSVAYNNYSFYPTRQLKLKVINTITGDAANYLATKTSSINKVPNAGQEWVFFEVEFSYVSSSGGTDDKILPGNILLEESFFNADGSSLGAAAKASFYDAAFTAYSTGNQMYPGGTSTVMVGLLVNKGYDKILLKVPNNSVSGSETNTWIQVNDAGSTIGTVDAVKTRFKLGEQNDHADDPIKLTLRNSLPTTISSYSSGDTRESSATITDFSYTVSGSSVKLTFTGEKTYDVKGSGQSRQVKVGWKLYDSEGYVVDDGTATSTSIKMGEKFKNCEDSIYGLEPGEYTLEIMGVN